MAALFSLLYGVVAYAASVATLAYLVGFSGSILVPRSVDAGPMSSWPEALIVDLLLVALFGVQHSVMARRGFKAWWTRLVPPAVERSTYLVATCAALVVLFASWRPIPEPIVWHVESVLGANVIWTIFALGWVLVLFSTVLIDHFELFGLRQVYARMTGRPIAPARFRTPLVYRYVRHPLYLGLLLGFWSTPVMTAGHLLFAAGMSAYILVGIAFEERDLIAQFGERYRRYRESVGMLVPRMRHASAKSEAPRGGREPPAAPHF